MSKQNQLLLISLILTALCIANASALTYAPSPYNENIPDVKIANDDSVEFSHTLDNGRITLRTFYTCSYDEWHITDNKDIIMKLSVITQPDDCKIYVEHMHSDVMLHGYNEILDGILQDTMDDKMHTGTEPGFWVSPAHDYNEIFAIEGYTQWLIEGWSFYYSGYGQGYVETKRLSEDNLIRNKIVGSEVVCVYDIIVETEDGDCYKYIVKDNFYVKITDQHNTATFTDDPDEEFKRQESRRAYTQVWDYCFYGSALLGISGIVILVESRDSDYYDRYEQQKKGIYLILAAVILLFFGFLAGSYPYQVLVDVRTGEILEIL